MSTYRSTRYRVNGYRSQPVSNRNSLYLSSTNDYGSSSYLSTDMSDFDRQFKRLLERTEKFTDRVERLQSTSSSLTKGFRNIDRNVTGRQREHVSLYDSLIDPDPISTEEEWKRYLDRGCLVEKAVEQLRRQYRYPKPIFEYSPESRSPYSYNITPTTKRVSNPRTPTDKYGRKVRDKGMEQLEKNIVKDDTILLYNVNQESKLTPMSRQKERAEKALEALAEVDEPTPPNSSTNSIKTLRNEILTAKDSKNDNTREVTMRNGGLSNRATRTKTAEKETIEYPKKKDSWRSRRYRNDTTETKVNKDEEQKETVNEKTQLDDEETEKKHSKTHRFIDSIKHSTKRRSRGRGKDSKSEKADKTNSDILRDEEVKEDTSPRREHASSKARPTTMYDPDLQFDLNDEVTTSEPSRKKDSNRNSLFLEDENMRKNKSSSSFHEYIPGHNVPLRERLRRKQMEQNNKTSKTNSDFDSVIVPDNSLAQRASKIIRAKYHDDDDGEDEQSTSHSKGNSLTSKFFRRFMGGDKESEKEKAKDNIKASVRKKKEDKGQNNENERNDDNSSSSKTQSPTLNSTTNLYESKYSNEKVSPTKDEPISRQYRRRVWEDNEEKPFANHTATSIETDTNTIETNIETVLNTKTGRTESSGSTNDNTVQTKLNDTSLDQSRTNDSVVYRRRKNRDKKKEDDIKLAELNRKSLHVYEEEIVPETKENRAEKLRLEFRTPERSVEEVEEDLLEEEKFGRSMNLLDDLFDRLLESPVDESENMKIELHSDVSIDSTFLDQLENLSPGRENKTFFENVENPSADLNQFIAPIEQENTLRMQQIDQMFDEIESVNQNMYEDLMNLTKKESNHHESKSDDEVFNASGSQRSLQYEPTGGKIQKMKIHQSDLMGSQRFTATKDNWNKASLLRTRSIDSTHDDKPASSVRKRTHSDDSERRSSLLDINDDAVKYVMKYTNQNIEDLKGENLNKKQESNQYQRKSNDSLSEVEKTRKDVDKMLENCDNIDKINNSISDSVKQDNLAIPEIEGIGEATGGVDDATQIIETAREITLTLARSHEDLATESDSTLVPTSPRECVADFEKIHESNSSSASDNPETNVYPSDDIYQQPELQDEQKEKIIPEKETTNEETETVLQKNDSHMQQLSIDTSDQIIVTSSVSQDADETMSLSDPKVVQKDSEDQAICENEESQNKPESNKQYLEEKKLPIEQSSPYSPAPSEYGTPPRTPSELIDVALEQQQSCNPIKDDNNNTTSLSKENTKDNNTNIVDTNQTKESNTKEEKPEEKEEKEAELTASPFSFSLGRSKNTQPKKHSSYLEKRQSHAGLFSQSDIPTFGGSLNSISKATDNESTNASNDSNIFRLTKVASTTRLSTLDQTPKLEPLDSSFRLLKISSAPKLNLLPPAKPLPKLSTEDDKILKSVDLTSSNQSPDLSKEYISESNITCEIIDVNEDQKVPEKDESIENSETGCASVNGTTSTDHAKPEVALDNPASITTNNDTISPVEPKKYSSSETTSNDTISSVELTKDSSSLNTSNDIISPVELMEDLPSVKTTSNDIVSHVEPIDSTPSVETSEIVNMDSLPLKAESPVTNGDQPETKRSLSSTIKDLTRTLSNGSTMSPFSGSEDETGIKRSTRPVLEKQLSIKEYRMKKLQKEGTIETSFSDDDPQQPRSDAELFSTVSSLADVSDTSVDMNVSRNKRYSHSKKDLRNIGMESSSSESDVPIRKTTGQRINEKLNRINSLTNPSDPLKLKFSYRNTTNRLNNYSNSRTNFLYKRTWHSTGEDETDKAERRKRLSRRTNFRSVEEY